MQRFKTSAGNCSISRWSWSTPQGTRVEPVPCWCSEAQKDVQRCWSKKEALGRLTHLQRPGKSHYSKMERLRMWKECALCHWPRKWLSHPVQTHGGISPSLHCPWVVLTPALHLLSQLQKVAMTDFAAGWRPFWFIGFFEVWLCLNQSLIAWLCHTHHVPSVPPDSLSFEQTVISFTPIFILGKSSVFLPLWNKPIMKCPLLMLVRTSWWIFFSD